MTGDELRAARERLGVSPADLAARAGVAADVLGQWEASAVPRAAAHKLDLALWGLERDAALARSGLPACEWVARFAALPDGPGKDPWVLEQHIGRCPACQTRGRYVEEHVRPRPESPWLAWLPPLPRAVLVGAVLVLVAGGGAVAVLILLVLGLASQNTDLLAGAAGLFVVCAAAGGLGGAVHHLTRPLRRGRRFGHYVSWVLAVEAAVFVALGLVALAAWQGLAGLGGDEFRAVTNPLVLAAAAAAGVLVALGVGARIRSGRAPEKKTS